MHKPEDGIEVMLDLLRKSGIDPRPEAKLHLAGLSKHIHHWNNMLNLVSRKDIGRLETYHFCDSVSVLPLLDLESPMRLLDVGGSNGLPGLVLAPILTAVLRDVYRYLAYRFADTPYLPADALAQVLSGEPFAMDI